MPTQLDDTLILTYPPCGAEPYQPGAASRAYSYTLCAAQGDHFSELPESPAFSARRVYGFGLSGHWPSDVWLRYTFPPDDAGAREQFHQWDGHRWHTIATAPYNVKRLEPHRVFDWFDGAKIVAQSPHWHESVSYRVEPFLVWGKTTHPAPDFSTVSFPWYREDQNVRVYYDVTASHEVFVTHVLTKERPDRSIITIARASATGEVRSQTVLDAAGFSDAHLAFGRSGEREVAMAWGSTLMSANSDQVRPWLRLFDGSSWAPFAVPGPPQSDDNLSALWFADDRIWARRGQQVWQFFEKKWRPHAQVPRSAALSTPLPAGTMWATDQRTVIRIDPQGQSHTVPFIDGPSPGPWLANVYALSADDIWLEASDVDNEQLLFRTKPMKLLSCDELREPRGG